MYKYLSCVFLCLLLMTTTVCAKETLLYSTHVQDVGWTEGVTDNSVSGTTGEQKRVEALQICIEGADEESGIEYSAHVEDIGWTDYVSDGETAGTTGQGKRIEALQVRLYGPISEHYDVYYRVHAADFGWFGWACNDQVSGSTGYAKRIEALQITLVPKEQAPPGPTGSHCLEREEVETGNYGLDDKTGVEYQVFSSATDWQNPVRNGAQAGSTGANTPLEIMRAYLQNLSGQLQYNTYLSNKGWMKPTADGIENGIGRGGLHLEIIQLVLAGDVSHQYDIYYRTHVSNIGWMGWAKNGQSAGTREGNKAIEAFEVRLVPKGAPAPGSTDDHYIDYKDYYRTHPKTPAVPGMRTVKNFLATALLPVGQTNYVLGGGRSGIAPVAGVAGTHIGVFPQWKAFFDQQNAGYNYTAHHYEFNNGLDCSGFVGWTVYNTLNKTSGGQGEIDYSYREPIVYSQKGYGSYTERGKVVHYRPGDIVSLPDHIYIVVGACSDGSIVLVHSSPPGVMLSGTTPKAGQQTEATRLARTYMQRYYPEYYNRYNSQLDRISGEYMRNTSSFSWGANFVGDPDGIRDRSAQDVLKILYNEKY